MLLLRILLVCLVASIALPAETRNLLEHPRPGAQRSKWWKWSVAAVAAGSATDAWSSLGRPEANRILASGPGGHFTARAIGIKAAVAGGSVAAQWLILRKRPETARAAAITNFGMAGLFTGAAVRNRMLPQPVRRP